MQPEKDEAVDESCRKNKKDGAAFFDNLKDHIDELIHSPMKEHVICFKQKMNKIFRKNSEVQEADRTPVVEAQKTSSK